MASPYKTFLGSFSDVTIPEPEVDSESEFEVSTEADFYVPRRPAMRRRRAVLPSTWYVITEEEFRDIQEEMSREEERLPLVAIHSEDKNDVKTLVGFLLSVIAHFLLTISSGSIQVLNGNYPEFELNVFRFTGSLLLAPPILLYRRQWPRLETRLEVVGTTIVTVLTVGFNSCLFASVKYAPLGAVGCLDKTSIMLVSMVMARIVMREKITIPKVLAAVVGTGGVLLVTQPWSEKTNTGTSELWKGYVLATAAGVLAAMKIIAQKRLIPTTDVVTIQFWTSLGGLVISGLVMAVPGQRPTLPSGSGEIVRNDWLFLLAHAFSTGLATLLIYKSQQMISAILFSLSTSFNVVFMLIGQYTVLKKFKPGPHKNAEEYSGAVIVVLSALFVPVYAIVKKKFFPGNQEQQQQQQQQLPNGISANINTHPRDGYEQIIDQPIR